MVIVYWRSCLNIEILWKQEIDYTRIFQIQIKEFDKLNLVKMYEYAKYFEYVD